MEILLLIAVLLAVDLIANLLGPDSRDVEAALRTERVAVRPDAWLVSRPDADRFRG